MSNKREVSFPPELVDRLADMITAEDDAAIIQTLRFAMTTADLSVRAPRKPGQPNNYALMPDHRVRVFAAKILAEIKHGRPKQSVDVNVTGLNAPLTSGAAARELLGDWEAIKRIGDEHVKMLKVALPAGENDVVAQDADAVAVDVDLPG